MRNRRRNPARLVFISCLLLAVEAHAAPPGGVVWRQAGRGAPSAPARPAAPPPPLPSDGDAPLIINTDLVTVNVTVTDRDGRHVGGLDKSAFAVTDDGVPQEISFFSDADTPVSLVVILDTSGSMSGDKIARAREALARFVETSHRGDEYFLISFSERARLLLDGTRDADAVLDRFTSLQPRGETALYDAAYLGVEKVTRGSRARRAILLITDGNDTCSRHSFKELRRSLQESDAVLYAVGVLGAPGAEARRGRSTLKELASVTGGEAFFPDSAAGMIEAFDRIALELRHQYSIGYRPSDLAGDSRWHRIKIKVTPPDGARLRVRSRAGFFALTNRR